MVATTEFEKRMAGIGIFSIVICKFNYWQEACLVILFPFYKDSEVYFHYAFLPFSLAIGLKIESRRKFSLDS